MSKKSSKKNKRWKPQIPFSIKDPGFVEEPRKESNDDRREIGLDCEWREEEMNENPKIREVKAFTRFTDNDGVNHPSYYNTGKVECIDAIESAVEGLKGDEAFLTGQVIKYLYRWKGKGGLQDLEKAQWYLKRLISAEKGRKDESSN